MIIPAVDYVVSRVSVMEGVLAVEIGADGSVYVWVDSVDSRYAAVTALFARYAPHVHGQVRGPSFPVGPLTRRNETLH